MTPTFAVKDERLASVGLATVALLVDDYDRAIAYFSEALGFESLRVIFPVACDEI